MEVDESEEEIDESVCLKRQAGVQSTCAAIKYEAQELAKSHITQHQFKASVCMYEEQEWVFSS